MLGWAIAAAVSIVAPEARAAPAAAPTPAAAPAPAAAPTPAAAPDREVAPPSTTHASATASTPAAPPSTASTSESTSEPRAEGRLSRYLQRPVRYGAHFLDHGVLQPAVAGGWPHGYRVELSLGLLDHVTLGATAHWLPSQPRPQVSPVVAIAFIRGRLFECGAWYFWSLFPPPRDDFDPATPSYQRRAQWLLATASFGQAWLTGGFDAGVVRARVDDPAQDPAPDTSRGFVTRWRFGGGLHLRAGTRRVGVTAQVLVPHVLAELRLDVRFGLFEKREKGGWKAPGKPEDWDRGAPW